MRRRQALRRERSTAGRGNYNKGPAGQRNEIFPEFLCLGKRGWESKVSLGFLRPYLKKNNQVGLQADFEAMGTALTGCTYIHVGKHTHKINQVGPASKGGLGFQKAAPQSP